MFEFYVKNVPTIFVSIKEQEVSADELYCILEEFYDNDDINDCNLNKSVANILMDAGLLLKYTGERMATLYKKTDKFEEFYKSFMDEFCDYHELRS